MRTRTWISGLAAAVLLSGTAVTGVSAETGAEAPASPPTNPTCQDLGYAHEFKIDPPVDGTYPVAGIGEIVLDLDDAGVYFDWTSTFGVDAVIAKGGDGYNLYPYDPESFGDEGLVSPETASGGPAALSHASFCYDYELDVTKTADTTFTRTYDWSIEKVGDQTGLTLAEGQQFLVNYDVTVGATFADSDWALEGDVTIVNPDPVYAATVVSVTDDVAGYGTVDVDCGVTLPYVLASGQTLTCSYGPVALPDGTARVNTATVATTGWVGDGVGTADVVFGDPSTEIDECIEVTDDHAGPLGTVCVDQLPKTFEYSTYVSGECGSSQFVNVAGFVAGDSGATGSSSWTVVVTVNCEDGCSLTPGYWKTHSEYGPAPYDDTWSMLTEDADTTFFLSGDTYYGVLHTAPEGNAYYILAHAYIAAELNGLNGADTSDVDDEMAAAEALLASRTPAQVTTAKTKDRTVWITLAEMLDAYNNGLVGPGHCDE